MFKNQFRKKISDMSSAQPAQTNERSANVFFDIVQVQFRLSCMKFTMVMVISVQHGDAVASPMLKNWPLFGQKFSKFGQSTQLHSHVSEVVSTFQTKKK